MTWTPPPTYELVSPDGRVLQYCLYGAPGGLPVIAQHGTPGSRWERPDVVAAINDTGLRMLVAGRPGFGSTRRAGRSVADVAEDVRLLAEWMLANVPGAVGHEYQAGHDPGDSVQRTIFQSLHG